MGAKVNNKYNPRHRTPNPKPQTPNPKPQTPTPKLTIPTVSPFPFFPPYYYYYYYYYLLYSVIAGLGVCPFTIDPDKAGIPIGGVRYRVSRAKTPDEAFFRYWEELKLLQVSCFFFFLFCSFVLLFFCSFVLLFFCSFLSPSFSCFIFYFIFIFLKTVSEKEISTVLLVFPEIDLFGNNFIRTVIHFFIMLKKVSFMYQVTMSSLKPTANPYK